MRLRTNRILRLRQCGVLALSHTDSVDVGTGNRGKALLSHLLHIHIFPLEIPYWAEARNPRVVNIYTGHQPLVTCVLSDEDSGLGPITRTLLRPWLLWEPLMTPSTEMELGLEVTPNWTRGKMYNQHAYRSDMSHSTPKEVTADFLLHVCSGQAMHRTWLAHHFPDFSFP